MKYELKYLCNDTSTIHENPSPEVIDFSIESLIPITNSFVILGAVPDEGETPPANSNYVQTVISEDTDAYFVEIQFTEENPCGKYKQYRGCIPLHETKKIFRLYTHGIIPDYSSWEDVTEELFGKPKKNTKKTVKKKR